MRIFNDLGRGLLAASTLAALQVASPIYAQYTPYPQAASGSPQATAPVYSQAVQQQARPQQQAPVQQQASAQQQAAMQQASVPQQQGYAPPQTYASSQPYAQPAPAQQAQAQPSYTQVAQRPVAQPAMSQPPQQAFSAPATQGYNPQQTPQPYAPPTVYSQYAPAQGSAPARPGVATPAYMAAAQNAAPAQSYQSYPQQQQPQYSAPYSPPRMAMAYQTPAPASPSLELTTPTENIAPGQVHAGNGPNMPQPVPGADYAPAQGYAAQGGAAPAGADCNCQTNGYESYPGHGYGNATAYGANNYSAYGCEQPGMMARVLGKHGGGYWFGGAYGLLMERDSTNEYPLSFASGSLATGDYPMPPDVVLSTSDVETGFQGGVEFRLGRTFGGGSSDPCGGCACGPTWGLETVYWTLFEDDQYAQYTDTASVRTYSMMPMRGLEYNGRPVHHYTDYGTPVDDYTVGGLDEIQVMAVHTRSSFEMQNFELNLLRLSLCGNACATPAMCSVGCDSGSCDTCATGDCGTGGCDASGYGYGGRRGFGSRFSCTGVCGFRYLELDETFMYGVDFWNIDAGTSGYLDYYSETENKLAGFQLGCNGMYRIGCKWGVHMNSLVGVYGNDIDVRQYFYAPAAGGAVYYSNGELFDVNASKTDVAMLGELRVGASYQATCRMRLYGGWRAMGVSGLALAGDQAPNAFLNSSQMSNYVNSNGSMILHGLQTGVEWNY